MHHQKEGDLTWYGSLTEKFINSFIVISFVGNFETAVTKQSEWMQLPWTATTFISKTLSFM